MELQDLINNLRELYGKRNCLFLPSLRQRIDYLYFGIADLEVAIRRQAGIAKIGIALARILARAICVADHFGKDFPLVEIMARKYPHNHCIYCAAKPCQCSEIRPDRPLAPSVSSRQLSWTVRQWCDHLQGMYGKKNSDQKIDYIISRLFREIAELQILTVSINAGDCEYGETIEQYAAEIADVIAWTMAVANYLKIDLEKAAAYRYMGKCWKCKRSPCRCTNIFKLVDWSKVGGPQLNWNS